MNWKSITIKQVQEIDKVRLSALPEEMDIDIDCKILAIVNKCSIDKIDSMPYATFLEERKKLAFLSQPITETKPIKYYQCGKVRYKMIYDVAKMPFARYIEAKTFTKDFTANLHLIAASMVQPQRMSFTGWKDVPYDASEHGEYANDLLNAPFAFIYNSCVFFYHLYRNWMEVSRDYLIKELMTSMKKEEAEKTITDLLSSLDGFIPPKILPNLKVSL